MDNDFTENSAPRTIDGRFSKTVGGQLSFYGVRYKSSNLMAIVVHVQSSAPHDYTTRAF